MFGWLFNNSLISKAAKLISAAENVFIFTGAGASQSAGIPTFRDVGGLWTNENIELFGSPQAWLVYPNECWNAYETFRAVINEAKPTATHLAIRDLEKKRKVQVATSNVDSLHHAVGTKALEIHGSLRKVRCMICGEHEELPTEKVHFRRSCKNCNGWMRHDVVLWEEEIKFSEEFNESISSSDCIIFIGTSGLITDIEKIVSEAKATGKKTIEINPKRTAISKSVDISLKMKADGCFPKITRLLK